MPAERQADFSVGPWLVRPQMNSVVRENRAWHVTPKSMEVLLSLARRDGNVVAKEEILKEVWKDTFVSDDALTRCVGELRRAFHDTARASTVIETVAKRGYRILQPVTWDLEAQTTAPDPLPMKSRERMSGLAAAGLLLALATMVMTNGSGTQELHPTSRARNPQRIVVLPLLNLSGDPEQDYLADGMTEELISQLAQIHSWRVISRTSAMHYKGTQLTLKQIGRELAVDGVIEGSVLRSGDRLRVSAQFIDARNDLHLWAGSFEREMADVLSLQAEIANAIGSELNLTLRAPPDPQRTKARKVVPGAYEEYLKGLHFFSSAQYAKAATHFEKATIHDPSFALAQAYLYEADGMVSFGEDAPPSERSLKAMQRALELDDTLAEAHTNQGDYRFYWRWDWVGGEAEFRRAVELNPGSVDAALHYAMSLHALGRWDAALREYRRAVHLDPVSYRVNLAILTMLTDRHRWQEALEQFRETMELGPQDAGAARCGGLIYQALGRESEAVRAYLAGDHVRGVSGQQFQELERAAAASGLRGYWQERLRQLRMRSRQISVSPVVFAYVYTQSGDKEAALEALEDAHRRRAPNLTWLKARAYWDPLRADPRFQALLDRMGFPK